MFGARTDMIYLSYHTFSARPDMIKLSYPAFGVKEIRHYMR